MTQTGRTTKRILWVDDEIDLLKPHLLFLQARGYHVDAIANGDDALELMSGAPYDLVLLDEQMPGRRGLEVLEIIRRLYPHQRVVMVTKSEEDHTMTEAIGRRVADYLVKPTSPRQVLSVVTRILEGSSIRQQRVAQDFAGRFGELSAAAQSARTADEFAVVYTELVDWQLRLGNAGEHGLLDTVQAMVVDLRRSFGDWVVEEYPKWMRDAEDRPRLSVDLVREFLVPRLGPDPVYFVVLDCMRLDQWRAMSPLLADIFEIDETYHYSILPTATPYARNAIFSGQYPDEIARARPEWWDASDDEGSLNAFEDQLLIEQLRRLTGRDVPVHYEKIFSDRQGESVRARVNSALKTPGTVIAMVFNFVDLMTHGRSESPILMEVARDEAALRDLTRAWFERSTAFAVLREAARRGHKVILTTDHGSILCQHPSTVFARRDATSNLRYKFGQDLRAEVASTAFSTTKESDLRIPAGKLGMSYLLALDDYFFVYPTKLREYQARYRNSFLHGGISPEEMIVPVATPDPAAIADVEGSPPAPYRRIFAFLRPHSGAVILAVFAAAMYALFDAAVYILLIPFVDALFVSGGAPRVATDTAMERLLDATVYGWVDLNGDPLVAIGRIIVLIIGVFFCKNLFGFVRAYLLAHAEQGVNRDLRNTVYDHLVELDLGFFGRVRTGQIVSRLTTEIEQIRTLVTREMSRLVSASFEFVAACAAMLLISWKLTLAAFVVIPAAMGIWGPLVNVLRRRDRKVLHLGGEVNAHLFETLAGIRLVKSSSAEERERIRFRALTGEYFRDFMRAEFARSLAAPMTEMLAAVGTVVLLWYGARLVVAGDVTGAHFVGFLGLSLKLYAPVKNVAKFPAVAQPGLVAAERVFEFLDMPAEVGDAPGAVRLPDFSSEIVFDEVTFSYDDGPPAVRDVSFTVPRGTVPALVGPSGSGKSTVVDLLARFFEASSGAIRVDGHDVRDVRLADLRSQLGIVSQETVLFHDTVRANIAYGRPEATSAEIEVAARAAHAHGFISAMASGYDTVVGERGVELSGGQRQRIAIARALLRDPPILIFDEATSALDTESERLIQDAIEHLLEGRTVIVVAHRLSTVQRADRIIVLEEGRIVEQGDHDTLMRRRGRYHRLHEVALGAGALPVRQ